MLGVADPITNLLKAMPHDLWSKRRKHNEEEWEIM